MRVLITRPEREATALANALVQRGHAPVIAPLFRLEIHRPPDDFAARLGACQAVLLTSANGARALAEASEQRSKPILAVGDTTAATAEGLGFTSVISASGDGAALGALADKRLDPKDGPLLHVSGADVASTLTLTGFEIDRVPLYEARAEEILPPSAQAALQARALDAATFFSPRAAETFARLVTAAGLAETCRGMTAIAISPAAAQPLEGPLGRLPFKAVVAAARPTRQAVLDEIDRLASTSVQTPGVQEAVPPRSTMSDAPSSEPLRLTTPMPDLPPAPVIRGGIGVVGAFVTGLVAAAIVLGAAVISLPYWPANVRAMWRGPVSSGASSAASGAASTRAPVATDRTATDTAAADQIRRDLTQRLDDLDKRVRGLANTAAQAERPAATPDPAVAPLRARIEALESKPAPSSGSDDKDAAALRLEIATLRASLQAIEQSISGQKDKVATLEDAVEKTKAQASRTSSDEQKALAAARASTAIGIAARLSAALESGRPFASDVALLAPLAQDDKKIAELVAALQPLAQTGVASRAALDIEFPAVAKAAMADDLADDSFGERVLGKLRSLVSLRRVGADVTGDTVEAKLARAEASLAAGDLAKAAETVKSLPPQVARATQAWLDRAEAHLAAQQSIDQLAAYAVSLLGQAR